jgi:hypothetical protein
MKARIETRTLGAILCAAVVALAISQAGASAGTQQENIPFSGVLFNPCNGEQVAAEGSFHNVTRVDTDASGGSHFFFHQNAHLSGIGLTTGAHSPLLLTNSLTTSHLRRYKPRTWPSNSLRKGTFRTSMQSSSFTSRSIMRGSLRRRSPTSKRVVRGMSPLTVAKQALKHIDADFPVAVPKLGKR